MGMFRFRTDNKFSGRDFNEEARDKDVPRENELTRRELDSSLGLLDNMSGAYLNLSAFKSSVLVDFNNVR